MKKNKIQTHTTWMTLERNYTKCKQPIHKCYIAHDFITIEFLSDKILEIENRLRVEMGLEGREFPVLQKNKRREFGGILWQWDVLYLDCLSISAFTGVLYCSLQDATTGNEIKNI